MNEAQTSEISGQKSGGFISAALDRLTSVFRPLISSPAVASADASACGSNGFSAGNLYDGAQSSAARSNFVGFPLTARQEISRFNRTEILRKIRALEANLGLIPRMKGQVRKYSVGFGIFPVPQTTDPAWNLASRKGFMDWANNPGVCDAAGAMTFWERQGFHAETLFAESESFDALVSSSYSGAPQLQLFDNSEVGNLGYGGGANEADFNDGVRVNAQNRPLEYLVASQPYATGAYGYGQLVSQRIAAADMIHLIRRKRANQLRGISPFAPGINCAIDKLDLRALITAAAKLHEALGLQVTNGAGEAPKSGISGQLTKILDANGTLTHVDEKFIRGAAITYMKPGEKIETVTSERPSQNLMEFLMYLIRDICLGTGLSFEIVWNMADLGGATARIALADAQWFFDGIQDQLNDRFNQRVWVWWCASMMKAGQLPQCADPRWWNCHWQGPPKLTADAGKSITGDIQALHNGMLNWEDYHSSRGANFQDKIGRQIKALAWAKKECETAGVEFEYIFSLQPGTPMGGSGAGQSSVGGAVE